MHDLRCDEIQLNFLLSAGQLMVAGPAGPSQNSFECVRGQECILRPFRGSGLLESDSVMLRSEGCQSSQELLPAIRLTKVNDPAEFSVALEVFDDVRSSWYFAMDAESSGYFLCWCASAREIDDACQNSVDYSVWAGSLRVLGPRVNQEKSCFIGQACVLQEIQGVDMKLGDLIMILSSCGSGSPVTGVPNGGIAEGTESWWNSVRLARPSYAVCLHMAIGF